MRETRVENYLYLAYPNIAYDEIISVEDNNNELFFNDIIEESGNSTVQIIIYNEKILDKSKKNESFECGWEGCT